MLDKETGDDLLTVTGTSNYQYTSECWSDFNEQSCWNGKWIKITNITLQELVLEIDFATFPLYHFSLSLAVALMLFFVAYIIFEVPSNFCLKKLGPSKWIAIICLLWGILTCCLGAISNFSSLAAVRFLLGAAEAGLFPGLVTCMALFYRPEERSLRVALVSDVEERS